MSERLLERTIARIAGDRRRAHPDSAAPGERATTFRAVMEERLSNVERQLDELKGRVNGLLFLLAGAVATEIVLRLLR
jgi:hypothetical protein